MARNQERRFRMNIEKLEGRSLTTALAVVSPAWIQRPEGGHVTANLKCPGPWDAVSSDGVEGAEKAKRRRPQAQHTGI